MEDIFSGGKRGQCITHSDLIVAYTGKTKLVKIVDYKLKICTSLVKGLNGDDNCPKLLKSELRWPEFSQFNIDKLWKISPNDQR